MAKFLLFIKIFIVAMLVQSTMGCAEKPAFVPPDQRSLPFNERQWQKNTFVVIAYHDIEDESADQRYLSVRMSALNEQFDWLRKNRYNVVSVDQILAAHNGGPALPDKAVLLTFDDGYSSFYRRVYPLLREYKWSAVLAPVGVWLDTGANKKVDFGGLSTDRNRFTTWKQIAEMSKSGFVEIGAHTYASHYGALANPQGNTEPAAANLMYDPKTKKYETVEAFKQRMNKDVELITQRITQATGKPPRVWVWPYGAANGTVLNILRQHGYELAMTLDPGLGKVNDLMNIPRILISNNPSLKDFAQLITSVQEQNFMRVAHVDLDYLYDPDPVQEKENLDKLVQRISDLRVTHVFLQAFSDPKGDGNIKQVYFPNRWIPMRQDLFNRVAWQLSSRPDVEVYAWMPVLAFDTDPSLPRIQRIDPKTGKTSIDPDQYRRLSPFNPKVRQRIIEIYQDLAYSAPIDGIIYHDDAVMSDFEDASPDAIRAYEKAGFPGSIATIRQDPEMMQRWTRYKSRYLIDFTNELTREVRNIRGPQVKSARNIFAMPILEPESEAWFAQNLDDFLANYDWVAPMAMPLMEKVPLSESNEWLAQLVQKVAQRPGALNKTVFELQSKDWTKPEGNNAISGPILAGWMRQLQLNGAQSFGYYPDNFITGEPPIKDVRPVLSSAWYPLYDR